MKEWIKGRVVRTTRLLGGILPVVALAGCFADRHPITPGSYFDPTHKEMVSVYGPEMDLHVRLAGERSRFFDGKYPSHTVNYDNSISPYPMTSGELFSFLDSRWYWDGQDIVRVNSRTWDFVRFTRDGTQQNSGTRDRGLQEDVVLIPGGPTIMKERDDSDRVKCIKSYGPDGSRLAVVFFDPTGTAFYANLYKDAKLDRMQVFYPNGRLRIEEHYDERGVRRYRSEWDEETNLLSTQTYDFRGVDLEDEFLRWLGWR